MECKWQIVDCKWLILFVFMHCEPMGHNGILLARYLKVFKQIYFCTVYFYAKCAESTKKQYVQFLQLLWSWGLKNFRNPFENFVGSSCPKAESYVCKWKILLYPQWALIRTVSAIRLQIRHFFNQKVLMLFLCLYENICCGYSLEAPQWSTSYK